jgi:DNA adenine methylase
MIFVEPFFGGGSIYFKKNPSIKEIINDLDKDIYILLKGLKKFDGDKISDDINSAPSNKIFFNKIKESKPTSEYNKFIRLLYLIKNSYFGKMQSFSILKSKINYGNKYQERLKNTIILNQDYKKVIDKYDSPNTLFYFDPPYEESKNIYTHHIINYEEMNNILKTIKGKFILSINFNKEFIFLFNNFKYKILTTKYMNPKGGLSEKIIKELIFMNF